MPNGRSASRKVYSLAIVAAIGIFLSCSTCRSKACGSPLLAFVTLPSALVGGVLAALPHGDPAVISLGSLVGFLTVLGIAARNSIMLIDHFQHLGALRGREVRPGSRAARSVERISPIMMTTLTTIVALLPLIVRRFNSRPRGRASHGGRHPGRNDHLDAAELFVVPSLYLRFGATTPAGEIVPPADQAAPATA